MSYRRTAVLAIVLCLLAVPASAQGGLAVSVGDIHALPGDNVLIPIEVKGAVRVGAMHIELVFDPAVLAPTGTVEPGPLVAGGMVVGSTNAADRVVLAVAHATGFSGDGVVASIVAHVDGKDGSGCPLQLEAVTAYDAVAKGEMTVSSSNGSITVGTAIVTPEEEKRGTPAAVWVLVGLVGVVILGGVAYAFTRRTTRRSAAQAAVAGPAAPAAGPAAAPAGGPAPAGRLGLQVSGVSASHTFLPLDQPVITIGRATHNSLVLDDEQVSREHARIVAAGEVRTIYDLGSSNGTFVNGQRVAYQALQPGDRITVGAATLLVRQG